MNLNSDKSAFKNFYEAIKHEWIETNGIGGWASSTIINAHTRSYHGLLVAATKPPVERMVLLSKIDEAIGRDGTLTELSSNKYTNCIHPHGYTHQRGFKKKFFPEFEYKVRDVLLSKTIAAIYGENTVVVRYKVLKADSPFQMELRPFYAGRNYHWLSKANSSVIDKGTFENNIFNYKPYDGIPEVFIGFSRDISYHAQPDWYYNFEYLVEKFRGISCNEDLFTPGKFSITLEKDEELELIISTTDPQGRKGGFLLKKELKRREELLDTAKVNDGFMQKLTLAADQFLVRKGKNSKTIIAGYHWFTDWGRDTMISLPGLCLATGRAEDGKKILSEYIKYISQGMLPNHFPDSGKQPEYNTVDAALWFFVACLKYYNFTGDAEFIRKKVLTAMKEIIRWYTKGTRFNIHADKDELLYAGEYGLQLTWMDAKVGNWVITPRYGKPVEVNALWYNALKTYSYLSDKTGSKEDISELESRAEKLKVNFARTFWSTQDGYLHDYVYNNYKDTSLRPNQLLALSLPFAVLEGPKALKILAVIKEKLLTPVGIRTLSPDHHDYKKYYRGDQVSRDSAYHQGTVWPWLLGPYIDALIKHKGKAGKIQAQQIIKNFQKHLSMGGIGTVSEIFDADSPHFPRGCIAQAWSVGEILRVCKEYNLTDTVEKGKKVRETELV